MPNASGLEKMRITAYKDANFGTKVDGADNPLTVWINPATYTESLAILYSDRQGQGASGSSPAFNRIQGDSISFDLVFDATGVVPLPNNMAVPNDGVTGIVDKLQRLFATMNGQTHRPNYVSLAWGKLDFDGVLQSMNTTYTLFKPNGTALRAKVSLSFQAYSTERRLAALANKSSPDLTHLVTVAAGDTLPLLCHRIYGDSSYYLKIARCNRLSGFRDLRPGMQLRFPPLVGSA